MTSNNFVAPYYTLHYDHGETCRTKTEELYKNIMVGLTDEVKKRLEQESEVATWSVAALLPHCYYEMAQVLKTSDRFVGYHVLMEYVLTRTHFPNEKERLFALVTCHYALLKMLEETEDPSQRSASMAAAQPVPAANTA